MQDGLLIDADELDTFTARKWVGLCASRHTIAAGVRVRVGVAAEVVADWPDQVEYLPFLGGSTGTPSDQEVVSAKESYRYEWPADPLTRSVSSDVALS